MRASSDGPAATGALVGATDAGAAGGGELLGVGSGVVVGDGAADGGGGLAGRSA
ncbi:MAG TPA: hypothetical protein VF316_24545 [Polyangiaceae bacterium]